MKSKIRVASINMTENGSTGNIMLQITSLANKRNMCARSFSTPIYSKKGKKVRKIENHNYYGWRFENMLHTIFAKISGYNGCFSYFGTLQLIRNLKKINPHILHLHNLHQFCINLPLLFRYIKKNNIRVVWTLHDCWSFTGHCPHFTASGCGKWRAGCGDCSRYHKYPSTYVDRSKDMYRLKKKWFGGVKNLTIVTPSEWLSKLTRESYLNTYPVHVINNGIDLSVFKPTENDFKDVYKCQNKKIVLGVAFGWGYEKGLDVFIELSKRLDSTYQIVLVGTNEEIDRKLPPNIISIHRTENREKLAEIYTAADVYVNPTRDDTYPTVNMEAIACGTPVVTFQTGGSPETIPEGCGEVVAYNDIDAMEKKIKDICENKPFETKFLLEEAKQFDMNFCFDKYIDLYQEIVKN